MPGADPTRAGLPPSLPAGETGALVLRVQRLLATRQRVLIGIAGSPGAGKTTLADGLADALASAGVPVAHVPMDGFHLADVELERLGRRDRKGAIDTFDGAGYLALLHRLAAEIGTTVYAPTFDRLVEQPIAGAIAVEPGPRVVITEGNYLLDESVPWSSVRAALTEVWFCDLDDDVRRERLVVRHVRFGKAPDAARAWVHEVDERNAERIARTRSRADLVLLG